jgi:hypothetical protein
MLIVFAIAKQLHTKPTTRTEVLTARFMVVLLTCGFPGSGNPGLVELYSWCQADLRDGRQLNLLSNDNQNSPSMTLRLSSGL